MYLKANVCVAKGRALEVELAVGQPVLVARSHRLRNPVQQDLPVALPREFIKPEAARKL